MTTPAMSRWRAALNTALLDDAKRAGILTGIEKVAPQSALAQVPAIAASLSALGTKGATLNTTVAAVASAETTYKASLLPRSAARVAFDAELVMLKTLVEHNATSAADLTAMGFAVLVGAPGPQGSPEPPAALVVKPSKAHGKARVTVDGKGYLGKFAAEVSTDPFGAATWVSLPGSGKQRKLSGYATGTKLWVHFAAIRFGQQSAWSVPVLVIIP
jgi:hypothetical protein